MCVRLTRLKPHPTLLLFDVAWTNGGQAKKCEALDNISVVDFGLPDDAAFVINKREKSAITASTKPELER
jgi:hypothetical protein